MEINDFLFTDEQAKRYFSLVTKEINKTLTEDEAKELEELIKLAQDDNAAALLSLNGYGVQ